MEYQAITYVLYHSKSLVMSPHIGHAKGFYLDTARLESHTRTAIEVLKSVCGPGIIFQNVRDQLWYLELLLVWVLSNYRLMQSQMILET